MIVTDTTSHGGEMPASVIVGGQYGSEGKGKTAYWRAHALNAAVAIRVGGSNSGHTVVSELGAAVLLRQLPTPALLPDVEIVLPAGAYLDLRELTDEIARVGLSEERLHIDEYAMVVTSAERDKEAKDTDLQNIASTLSGVGAAVSRRVERRSVVFAKDIDELRPFLCDAPSFIRPFLDSGRRIVLEGTQGFGLSLLHSRQYPYTTSRDTSAAAVVSEAGLSPLDVDEVILVIRALPIRVGGTSGPLPGETTWEEVTASARAPLPLWEFTTVTKRLRRVAVFTPEVVRGAIRVNQPTAIVLNHLDQVDARCFDDSPTATALEFVQKVESQIERSIDWLGTSPSRIQPRAEALIS